MNRDEHNRLSKQILDAAITVHKEMGPGLVESVYQYCMVAELKNRGIRADEQVVVPLYYKGVNLCKEFKIDILVENEIVIEIKATDNFHPVHEAQLISYLKLANKWLGFLINFHVPLLKDGFQRFVNGYLKE
jgi:GxxExxY protein